jgi:predicted SprT family Zn-dependent metalloprotease
MDPAILRRFALERMTHFGLIDSGWSFRFDGAKRRFGVCRFARKEISVSRHLVELNDEEECRDTVLHEIAHAIAGPRAGHGPAWKRACLAVGAKPERCFRSEDVAQPSARFNAVCPNCGTARGFYRRPARRRVCASCCTVHAAGRLDGRFVMRVIDAHSGEEVGYQRRIAAAVGRCPSCERRYEFRRRVRSPRACGSCCKAHANGRFDDRFRLIIENG